MIEHKKLKIGAIDTIHNLPSIPDSGLSMTEQTEMEDFDLISIGDETNGFVYLDDAS